MNSIRRIGLVVAAMLMVNSFSGAPAIAQQDEAAALNMRVEELFHAGRYSDALPLAERALAISESALGPEHPDIARLLNSLAELYQAQGRYADAEPLYRRALAISESALGPEHPDIARLLNNLAELYQAQGRYADAQALYTRALAISERVLGPEHPDIARSLNNLAELYQAQSRYADAEPLYRRALAISQRALGPENAEVARLLNNLAELYQAQGRYADAEPLYRRAVAINEKVLGPSAVSDSHIVEFLFATTRKQISFDPARFSGERGDLTYGAARVRVPEEHHIGRIELPGYTLWSLAGYENKPDEKKHFVIRSVVRLPDDDWKHHIAQLGRNEALVFVHGYNTSFEDALYRNAQIIFDLQYKRGISVLFSWASNGRVLDYLYDTNSALNARASFLEVLRALRSAGVEKIHVLAHSMGNLVVLEALAQEARTSDPLNIAQLIMAAPDVDLDAFAQLAPLVRPITRGMTLYASSADKAMDASRALAKVPRAGDVTAAGPIVLPDIDTIDVTPVGQELFGLNHDTFATGRTVLSDVSRIVLDGLRPPDARLPVEIWPMPEGALPPKFWRYRP
jgi:esterase/lipase superfamily enzyme/Tfp pilus assembly protein PilF